MITLEATKTLSGIASVASQLTATITGMELASGIETYKQLYQGQLSNVAGTLYTVPAATVVFIRSIHVANNDSSARTFQLFVGGTAAANALFPARSIPPGGFCYFGSDGWQTFDASGALQVAQTPSGSAGGDLTGTYPNPTVGADKITYAQMQNVSATSRVLGRITAGAGDPEELTAANVKTILALAQADITGLTTASNPQFATVELGAAADTTLSRLAAGIAAVEGKRVDTWDGWIVKAVTESVASSTVVQNDDELLTAALVNGSVYLVEIHLIYDSTAGAGTPDLKLDLGEDATVRGSFFVNRLTTADAAAGNAVEADQTTTLTMGTAAAVRGALITGLYRSGGGTFRLRWAQNTSGVNATRVLAGSLLRYRLIA